VNFKTYWMVHSNLGIAPDRHRTVSKNRATSPPIRAQSHALRPPVDRTGGDCLEQSFGYALTQAINGKMPEATRQPRKPMSSGPASIVVLDSITHLKSEHAGQVVVAGSHGGAYAAYLAAAGHVAAIVLNDAGVGKDKAGIAVLAYFDAIDGAACTIGHMSARIGEGQDMIDNGVITGINKAAAALGCKVGERCAAAAGKLLAARPSTKPYEKHEEARFLLQDGKVKVWGIDSVSLVRPEDKGCIVIAGSHGAILGGKPETALKYPALAAVFHDAGIGKDRNGVTRLPALDPRGIAAAVVAADSARIGDARSMWDSGRLSVVNETAKSWGLKVGMSVPEFCEIAMKHGK
jgi:hypothetical protein